MAEEAEQRDLAQHADEQPRQRSFTGAVDEVEAVKAEESQGCQEMAQGIEAEPVDGRVLGMIGDRRATGHGKAFAIAFERRGIPAVGGQVEFLLERAKYVGRAHIKEAA